LAIESFDKIVVSVMAKKVAVGSTHIIIDVPMGPHMKVRHKKDAIFIGNKFHYLAEKFGKKLIVHVNKTYEPAGFGIGPALEIRDVLAVLEQNENRPKKLEKRALDLTSKLLDLCFEDIPGRKRGEGLKIATEILQSGKALAKLREIVQEQGGNPNFKLEDFKPGKNKFELKAKHEAIVKDINTKEINSIARILGSPSDPKAGVLLRRRLGDKVKKNDILLAIYSSNKWRLQEGRDTLSQLPIYYFEN
jgi:thymidine phosphorylase